MIALLELYQVAISPLFGGGCRFHPSCSEYARLVIERDGACRGAASVLRRLGRCHPWGGGGLDLP